MPGTWSSSSTLLSAVPQACPPTASSICKRNSTTRRLTRGRWPARYNSRSPATIATTSTAWSTRSRSQEAVRPAAGWPPSPLWGSSSGLRSTTFAMSGRISSSPPDTLSPDTDTISRTHRTATRWTPSTRYMCRRCRRPPCSGQSIPSTRLPGTAAISSLADLTVRLSPCWTSKAASASRRGLQALRKQADTSGRPRPAPPPVGRFLKEISSSRRRG